MAVLFFLQMCFAFVLMFATGGSPLYAQALFNASGVVASVSVEGCQTTEEQDLLDVIHVIPGMSYSPLLVNNDIKRIYRIGSFKDVDVHVTEDLAGVHVVFVVTEYPHLKSLKFVGCKKIKEKVLRKKFDLPLGKRVSPHYIDVKRREIEDFYVEKGFDQIFVDVERKEEGDQVHYAFFIEEDRKYHVRSIQFDGVDEKEAKTIKKLMQTKERFLVFRKGFFSQAVFDQDVEGVKSFFQDKGYLDCIFHEPEVKRFKEDGRVLIQFRIEKKERYRVGSLAIVGHEPFDEESLKSKLKVKEGDLFSYTELMTGQSAISATFSEDGYIFANSEIRTFVDKAQKIVDVVFNVDSGGKAYVRAINILGNDNTQDKVISRELKFKPLDQLNSYKINRSYYGLQKLDYFSDINLSYASTDLPEFYDVNVSVVEKRTGLFSFGGGYSSVDGALGFIRVQQNNFNLSGPPFLGGGQRLSLNADIGQRRSGFYIDLVEPWLFNRPYSFGSRVYRTLTDLSTYSGYDEERTGFRFSLGRRYEYNVFSLAFKFENINITVDNFDLAPFSIARDQGEHQVRSFEATFIRDRRDNPIFPTKGYKTRFSTEWIPRFLGSSMNILETRLRQEFYFKPFPKIDGAFKLRLRGDLVFRLDDEDDYVPIFQRVFAGGAFSVRGYRERGVGPRYQSESGDGETVVESSEALGGQSSLVFSIEYWYPIGDTFRLLAFFDAGKVWEDVFSGDSGDGVKKGVGFGLWVNTPIGPIRIDYGIPLDKDNYNEGNRIHFSAGQAF